MKKLAAKSWLLLPLVFIAWAIVPSEPKITLTYSPSGFDSLVYVLDQSNAPHPLVKGVMEEINKQASPQIQKLRDSAMKAQPKKTLKQP